MVFNKNYIKKYVFVIISTLGTKDEAPWWLGSSCCHWGPARFCTVLHGTPARFCTELARTTLCTVLHGTSARFCTVLHGTCTVLNLVIQRFLSMFVIFCRFLSIFVNFCHFCQFLSFCINSTPYKELWHMRQFLLFCAFFSLVSAWCFLLHPCCILIGSHRCVSEVVRLRVDRIVWVTSYFGESVHPGDGLPLAIILKCYNILPC